MSKRKRNRNNLGKLQRRIILHLAEGCPETINETDKKIHSSSGHYKSTNFAFHSLETKGLIKKYDPKEYLNRKFDTYWLTVEGLRVALKNGVDHTILRQNVEKMWGEQELTPLFFELVHAFGPKNVDKVFDMFEANEKGEWRIISLPVMSTKRAKTILKILKKYPAYAKQVKKALIEVAELL